MDKVEHLISNLTGQILLDNFGRAELNQDLSAQMQFGSLLIGTKLTFVKPTLEHYVSN